MACIYFETPCILATHKRGQMEADLNGIVETVYKKEARKSHSLLLQGCLKARPDSHTSGQVHFRH